MPRRPEIGNVQLYPNRPLKKSDKNGYVLKFYCPIRQKRIRKNCGTRDKREARRILRECRERLLNGEYERSGGAIIAEHEVGVSPTESPSKNEGVSSERAPSENGSWEACVDEYKKHQKVRVRETSLNDALSRIHIAERIFDNYREEKGLPIGLPVQLVFNLDQLEFLQERLLAGDEGRYDSRSPNTVNSMMGAIMAFVRFCHRKNWISSVPHIEDLKADSVMKGRPLTEVEFDLMIEVTPDVVGQSSAESWRFALSVLWESGFRVGELMDFHWTDNRHICPSFPKSKNRHPTITIPSTQKNGRNQEIPMLPGLQELLREVPQRDRNGWIVNPLPIEYTIQGHSEWYRPSSKDLEQLVTEFSNCSIATACNVSETTVRKWLAKAGIRRKREFKHSTGTISKSEIARIRRHATRYREREAKRSNVRLTKERVGRIIAMIGKEAGIVVQEADDQRREKFASAHDLRRGCAMRLINAGVSAESLKVIMRHKDFATTEKHYGALRSAQSAANEVAMKLTEANSTPLVGGFMGGTDDSPTLDPNEVVKLKALLNSI